MLSWLAILPLASSPILPADQTNPPFNLTGLVRSISQFTEIKNTCRAYYKEDIHLLEQTILLTMGTADTFYGTDAWKKALPKEMKRRRLEVETTGASQWCTYQHGYLRGTGLKDFFLE
jgi:hypothetical protein